MAKVTVRVQPGASRSGVEGKVGSLWKLAIAAPPIEGRANKASVAYLAKLLGRPKRDVALVVGAKSRTKTFEVAGLTSREIDIKLAGDLKVAGTKR